MQITESAADNRNHASLLILGAGWTSTFLIPLLEREHITYAATTTDGRNGTIRFKYDPGSSDLTQFRALPYSSTVLIVFPLTGQGPAARLAHLYSASHPHPHSHQSKPRFIQLGVTSIWTAARWQDENAPYDATDPRAIAEDELLRTADADAAVLSLAGLYGGARRPRDWLGRVVRSKVDLRAKGALHVIHGEDVARAVIALHRDFTPGKRWLLCDLHVYDWWDLAQGWTAQALRVAEERGDEAEVVRQKEMLAWVGELMIEEGVRALPRDASSLGRALDGRAFWKRMGIWPSQGRLS
ncbi:hypothetical protein F4779DRAFT_633170 [Xylariaceae sp. FL0662B]|nr:hypothetical protein F4779DRAFT_633170 [Xylariaceae sp. FL0662B]